MTSKTSMTKEILPTFCHSQVGVSRNELMWEHLSWQLLAPLHGHKGFPLRSFPGCQAEDFCADVILTKVSGGLLCPHASAWVGGAGWSWDIATAQPGTSGSHWQVQGSDTDIQMRG